MLARFVRLTLALESLAYLALGGWLYARRGWSPFEAAACALAIALGARLAFLCATSFASWLARSPRAAGERIGIAGVPRYLAAEYRALLADNLLYLPAPSLAVRPDPPPAPAALTPVILVHGYMSNRGYFRALVRALESRSPAPVFVPDFPVLFTSIERFADALHDAIERIAHGCGRDRVALVCHSMGGLAAREYLRIQGPERIARLVTIASPHHGTALASAGLGLNARQMRRGSAFLRRLEESEAARLPPFPALSIYSPHDNLVSPQATSVLPWARSLALPGAGHVAILSDPRTLEAVASELR